MSNCKACSKPVAFRYRTERGTSQEQADGSVLHTPGPPMLTPDGEQLIENLCEKCIDESRLNRPADYYDGCWVDKHCHPSHIVERKPKDYLL